MAKAFYSMDEVCGLLGKNQDEVRALVRTGTLREFRDSGKVFFKSEDVDKLAAGGKPEAAAADMGEIVLEPAEKDQDLLSLSDTGGGTSIIGLEPLDDEETPPAEPPTKKEDTVITASGIGVFDEDELEIGEADPGAKTHITAGEIDDQVALEGSGSGSGLLDLTREADDTSLGAELLDEIYPGEEVATEARAEPVAAEPAATAEEEEPEEAEFAAVESGEVIAPLLPAGDPSEGIFSGLLVGAILVLAVGASVGPGVLLGYLPDYAGFFSNYFWYFLGGTALVVGLSVLIGWFLGRAMGGVRRA